MTRARREEHAAAMRCENTEHLRRGLWVRLGRMVARGKLTASQAAEAKREFWEARRADQRAASGAIAARTGPRGSGGQLRLGGAL